MRFTLSLLLAVTSLLSLSGKTLDEAVYRGDTTLREVCIPAYITEIGEKAFEGCVNLREVTVAPGSRLKKIGKRAFIWCENLERIDLPGSLEEIGDHAFAYCFSLREINFPSSLRKIGMNAFSCCSSLTEVLLPPGLTTLDSYAFASCSSLEKVMLSSSCKELGELIFASCHSLEEIGIPARIPPTFECGSFLFEPEPPVMYRRCTLSVPPGTITAYRAAHAWSLFSHIKEF